MSDKQHFDSGAVRDTDEGKLRYDLIPPGPLARLAKRYTEGAAHYGDHNWTKGIPSSRHLQSLMRHLEAVRAGDTSEDHIAAVAWNAFAVMFNESELPEQHDLPEYPWISREEFVSLGEASYPHDGFNEGDRVRVLVGKYKGRSGRITEISLDYLNGIAVDVVDFSCMVEQWYCDHEIEVM